MVTAQSHAFITSRLLELLALVHGRIDCQSPPRDSSGILHATPSPGRSKWRLPSPRWLSGCLLYQWKICLASSNEWSVDTVGWQTSEERLHFLPIGLRQGKCVAAAPAWILHCCKCRYRRIDERPQTEHCRPPTKPKPVRLHARKVRSAAKTSRAMDPEFSTTVWASCHQVLPKKLRHCRTESRDILARGSGPWSIRLVVVMAWHSVDASVVSTSSRGGFDLTYEIRRKALSLFRKYVRTSGKFCRHRHQAFIKPQHHDDITLLGDENLHTTAKILDQA